MTKILIAGDFCPAGSVEKIVLEGSPGRIDRVFEEIRPLADRSDYVVVNLECPLTDATSPIEKIGPNLKADPKTALLLKNLGVDLVALANNHVYDYGQAGLKDTLHACSEHGIATVGAGETLTEAQDIAIASIAGKRVAFVNCAENEFCNANPDHGGANPLDIVDNTRQIHAARRQADAVIVIIHGGNEYFHYPSPRMVKQYRFFAEQGATAIIAHHPHCVAGYEVYQGVPIFYSLGNFLFAYDTDFAGWYEGYMVELDVGSSAECEFSIIPYEQCRDGVQVRPLNEDEQTRFQERLAKLSDCIRDERRLEARWEEFTEMKSKSYLYAACMRNKRLLGLTYRAKLLQRVVGRRRLRNLLHLIRCEAHRDVLVQSLEKFI